MFTGFWLLNNLYKLEKPVPMFQKKPLFLDTKRLACVADALNLLYIEDCTKGLDECVGRLQRRL